MVFLETTYRWQYMLNGVRSSYQMCNAFLMVFRALLSSISAHFWWPLVRVCAQCDIHLIEQLNIVCDIFFMDDKFINQTKSPCNYIAWLLHNCHIICRSASSVSAVHRSGFRPSLACLVCSAEWTGRCATGLATPPAADQRAEL